MRANASVGPLASCAASAIVSCSSASCATTRFTMPILSASSAETTSPVKYNSRALPAPTSFCRKYEPPKSPLKPTLRKIVPSFAFSDATRRSHASARLRPAPTAWPLTIAIVGLGIVCSTKLVRRCASRRPATPRAKLDAGDDASPPLLRMASRPAAMPLTSPPAQNARPAPVNTTQRTLRSLLTSSR